MIVHGRAYIFLIWSRRLRCLFFRISRHLFWVHFISSPRFPTESLAKSADLFPSALGSFGMQIAWFPTPDPPSYVIKLLVIGMFSRDSPRFSTGVDSFSRLRSILSSILHGPNVHAGWCAIRLSATIFRKQCVEISLAFCSCWKQLASDPFGGVGGGAVLFVHWWIAILRVFRSFSLVIQVGKLLIVDYSLLLTLFCSLWFSFQFRGFCSNRFVSFSKRSTDHRNENFRLYICLFRRWMRIRASNPVFRQRHVNIVRRWKFDPSRDTCTVSIRISCWQWHGKADWTGIEFSRNAPDKKCFARRSKELDRCNGWAVDHIMIMYASRGSIVRGFSSYQ